MEESRYVDATLDLYREVRSEHARVGVCLQAYLHRTFTDLDRLLPLGPAIRVVKGAYNEPPAGPFPKKRALEPASVAIPARLLREAAPARAPPGAGPHAPGPNPRPPDPAPAMSTPNGEGRNRSGGGVPARQGETKSGAALRRAAATSPSSICRVTSTMSASRTTVASTSAGSRSRPR